MKSRWKNGNHLLESRWSADIAKGAPSEPTPPEVAAPPEAAAPASQRASTPTFIPIAPYKKRVGHFRPKRYDDEKPANKLTRLPFAVNAALMTFARENKVNVSAYIRSLVVEDLAKRGYLPHIPRV